MDHVQVKFVAAVILVLAVAWLLRKTVVFCCGMEDDKRAFSRGCKDGYIDGVNGTYRTNFETGSWEHPDRKAVWKHYSGQWILAYGEGYDAGFRRGRKRAKPCKQSRKYCFPERRGPENGFRTGGE